MKKISTKLILLFLINIQVINAQVKRDDIETYKQSEVSTVPSYIRFKEGKEPLLTDLKQWLTKSFPLNENFDFILLSQDPDQLGFIHYRYQETYNGIPIQGSRLVAHTKQGRINSINGLVFDNGSFKTTTSKINEKAALATALNHVHAEIYKWENPEEEKHLKATTGNPLATYYPKGELVYTLKQGKLAKNNLNLAYRFDVYASKPLYRSYIYIDAVTNKIINEESRIHFADIVGSANTAYSGTQPITTDSYAGSYRLRESGRGNGINTYNLQQGTDYSSAVDFTDANNVWNNVNPQLDQYGTDVHWGTEKTYDYYWIKYNRNSIDNNGFQINSYVHYDVSFFNAFWDGAEMTYGDGGYMGSTPLVSIDIVGHEITHGLTTNTADLVYSGESGGLNESFSDIFGTSIEFYAKPATASWLLGDEIGYTIRSMSNPNDYDCPDTYHGVDWDPWEEVHNISGVQNFWFYLLSVGGFGTNDNGDNYNVNGIGIDDAAKIAFRNLTVYLTPNSNYADARYYAIQSAIDLFGPCSPEVTATANAWYAVGVGGVYSNTVQSDFTANSTSFCAIPAVVNFTNTSSNGITYLWNFGDGTTSTLVNPTHTYNNFGTYSVKLVTYGGVCGTDSITKTAYIIIDSLMSCPTSIPSSGSITETACTGLLTDDGGQLLDYSAYSNGSITISPAAATAITLNFSSFNFEDYYDFLNIYAGPDNTFPLIGSYTGSTLPGGGTVVINSGTITIQQTSDYSVEFSGFELSWQCTNNPVAPVANFIADSTISCSGNITFTDLSANAPTSWLWNFGDGNTSTLQNPVHYYASTGIYTVSLLASNSVGSNSYSISNYINVNSAFCAGVSMPSGSGAGPTQTSCFGVLYDNGGMLGDYSDNTNSTIVIAPAAATQITLDFSSFNFEDGYDFIEVYDGAVVIPSQLLGHYTGTTLPAGGAPLTFFTGTVTILQHTDFSVVASGFEMTWSCSSVPLVPTAGLSADSLNTCSGLVHFYDQSAGIPTAWLWNFGDGTTSTLQNPTHLYANNGNYNVSLQVSNSSGSDIYTAVNYIHVNDAICNSVVIGSVAYVTACSGSLADDGGITGNYSDNTNSVTTIMPSGATQITLTFSSFNFETSYDFLNVYAGPSTASPLVGSYTGSTLPSSLLVNSASATIQQSTDFSVQESGFELHWQCSYNPVPPLAGFIADSTISCTGTIHFSDLSVNSPTSWFWDFGDGSTSILQNPTHHYASNGTYSVSLQVTNSSGTDNHIVANYIIVNSTLCNYTSIGSTQSVTSCAGLLTDDGGISGNYSNAVTNVTTIAPAGATQITLSFSLFDLESVYDSLYIFSGPSVTGLLIGGYSGNTLPGGGSSIVINDSAVTIKQVSDFSVNMAGFEMSWTCTSSIGINEHAAQTNMLVFPNPAHDAITITYSSESNNPVSVKLVDALGKNMSNSVLDNPMNQLHKKTIDISEYPNGVYFVEITDGLKSVNKKFVVIK